MWWKYEPRLLSASPIWRRCADKPLSCFVYRRRENKLQRLVVVLFLQTSNHYPLRWFYLCSSWFFELLLSLSFIKKDLFTKCLSRSQKRKLQNCANFFSPLLQSKRTKRTLFYTRSPFVTLLSRRAQSGRWSSFGKRVWFTESHIVLIISFLLVLFTHCILDIK